MIVIISNNADQSTSDVIDWLLCYEKKIKRINETDEIKACSIDIDNGKVNITLNINGENINLTEVDSIWFRRGYLRLNFPFSLQSNDYSLRDLTKYLNRESNTLEDFFIYFMSLKKSLGDYHRGNSNKLIALSMAKDVGLCIPATHIDTCKYGLEYFHNKYGNCITKDIQDTLYCEFENRIYYTMTSRVSSSKFEKLEEKFFPSLLQEEIKKKYELRIFYLKGVFYSMAIFSQQDKQTEIDYRNYNEVKPNRMVPYSLPQGIEQKLTLFMHKMLLDTGSIDMIVTSDFKYVFLEVNPVGQYDMVSHPCNYYLHEKIARIL